MQTPHGKPIVPNIVLAVRLHPNFCGGNGGLGLGLEWLWLGLWQCADAPGLFGGATTVLKHLERLQPLHVSAPINTARVFSHASLRAIGTTKVNTGRTCIRSWKLCSCDTETF